MALGSVQPLTEMGGKDGRCVGLKILPPSCADCLEIYKYQSPGNFGTCLDLYRDYSSLHIHIAFNMTQPVH